MLQPYDAYVKYMAIRQHFLTDSYDFFKYNGKMRATEASFTRRRDTYMFAKLGKMNDLDRRIACSFVDGYKWVNETLSPEAQEKFLMHLGTIEALSYKLTNQYLPAIGDIKAALKPSTTPGLHTLYLRKVIPIEVMVVFDDMFKLDQVWHPHVSADPLWETTSRNIRKFRPFFTYDNSKIHKTIVDFLLNS